MASAVFTAEQEELINTYPVAKAIDYFRDSLPKDKSFNQYVSSTASSEDALSDLKSFLYALCYKQPARSITLPDSPNNLAHRLRKFLTELTLSTIPKHHWSLLLEKVALSATELEIWTAIVELLEEFDRLMATSTEDSVSPTAQMSKDTVKSLKKDWKSAFIPDSLKVLKGVIQGFDGPEKNIDDFYARTLVFIQSSGMGKSRLADAFGKGCPMINFVLREKSGLGYPPADDEILSLMRMRPSDDQNDILQKSPSRTRELQKSRADVTWYHSLAVGLLQASFEKLNDWVKEQPAEMGREELAALRHENMAYNSESNETLDHRSSQRINFCQSVAIRAKEIANNLINESSWRWVFDKKDDTTIRTRLIDKKENNLKDLHEAARKLLHTLGRFQSTQDHPPLVVVFDEASSLLEPTITPGKVQSGRYIALNRIMSCLKEHCIWFFFISTESQVGTVFPLDDAPRSGNYAEDPSSRISINDGSKSPLKRISPFLALRLDIQDRNTMEDPAGRERELSKSLSDFGELSHMAMFGRRLWVAYTGDPKGMNEIARLKLIGGKQLGEYSPTNKDHVFAALSFRLSLDPCMHNSKSIPLIRTAVNSYMRVVISIDEERGSMHTITPSEPILAKAAMEYLCHSDNWSISISTLVRNLFDNGLVEKGLKGELYARLLLVLAHDWVRLRRRLKYPDKSDREPHQGLHTPKPEFSLGFMKSFTVRDFLEALYVKDYHESIHKVDSRILEARMNFTHFIPTHKSIGSEVIPDLLHELLRRSAALQLDPNQPTYDILLPIYFGKEDEPLDSSKCGCILIQVKNQEKNATMPKAVFLEKFTTVGSVNTKKQKASDASTKREGEEASGSSTSPKKQKASDTSAKREGEEASDSSTSPKKQKASDTSAKREGEEASDSSTSPKKQKASNTSAKREGEEASDSSTSPKKAKVPKGPKAAFNEMTNPILLLVFDLGLIRTKNFVQVSYSSNDKNPPRVWAIYSRGHDDTVFRCLKLMGCTDSGMRFFTSTLSGENEHDKLARKNELFSQLGRDFRYSLAKDEDVPPNKDEGDVPPNKDEGDVPPNKDEGDAPPNKDEGDAPPKKRLRMSSASTR